MKRHGLIPLLFVAGALAPTAARADVAKPTDKQVCVDAYAQAQSLRDAHKLIEARTQLRLCAQATCAAFIVKDCTGWLVDADARVPSVVLTAKDAAGSSMPDVVVSLDGAALQARLDGESMDVNPGPHTFTFTAKDGRKVDRKVVVAEGQKAQNVTVTFDAPVATAAPPPIPVVASPPVAPPAPPVASASVSAPPPVSQPTASPGFWTMQRVAGMAIAGVGLAGVIVGGVFGGMTFSEASQQNSDCGAGPTCANHTQGQADHSSAVTDGTLSTIGLVAGGALVATGAVLLLTGGRKSESPGRSASAGFVVAPSIGRGGGGVSLRMEF